MSFIRLRASNGYDTITEVSEECLRKLRLGFTRNGEVEVTEFEVSSPAYFRVVIETYSIPVGHTLFLPSIRASNGTTISIRFDIDDDSKLEIAKGCARSFLRALVEALPQPPWRGVDRLSHREEKKWKNALL